MEEPGKPINVRGFSRGNRWKRWRQFVPPPPASLCSLVAPYSLKASLERPPFRRAWAFPACRNPLAQFQQPSGGGIKAGGVAGLLFRQAGANTVKRVAIVSYPVFPSLEDQLMNSNTTLEERCARACWIWASTSPTSTTTCSNWKSPTTSSRAALTARSCNRRDGRNFSRRLAVLECRAVRPGSAPRRWCWRF